MNLILLLWLSGGCRGVEVAKTTEASYLRVVTGWAYQRVSQGVIQGAAETGIDLSEARGVRSKNHPHGVGLASSQKIITAEIVNGLFHVIPVIRFEYVVKYTLIHFPVTGFL